MWGGRKKKSRDPVFILVDFSGTPKKRGKRYLFGASTEKEKETDDASESPTFPKTREKKTKEGGRHPSDQTARQKKKRTRQTVGLF